MKKLKGIDGKLDIAWSLLVKLEAGMKCEIENCQHKPTLNSHHIFTRSNRSTRWDTANGVCLCVGHHTFSSKFSAHQTPTEFTYWLHRIYGDLFMEELSVKAHGTKKWTIYEKEELLKELNEKIKYYQDKC
jgi:hypothetical protein